MGVGVLCLLGDANLFSHSSDYIDINVVMDMIINQETGVWAVYGGVLLGGGGGGDLQEGLRILDLALSFKSEIPLLPLSEIHDGAILLTASLVGSPASPDKYVAPDHYRRVYELFQERQSTTIGGIITNEMGAQSSTNGWVLSAMTGLPLIDAPCNGRAHPTGIMGSLGLAEEENYLSVQTAIGGRGPRELEIYARGSLESASALIRNAATRAGGFVTVLRNPVSADYVKRHAALGALGYSIRIGQTLYRELGDVSAVIEALAAFGIQFLCQGVVSEKTLKIDGGFDIGTLVIESSPPVEVTFWNEYMTADRGKRRLATFPDLIAVLDSESGLPLTSAAVTKNKKVVLVKLSRENLLLGSSMSNRHLYEDAEKHLKKDLIGYVF